MRPILLLALLSFPCLGAAPAPGSPAASPAPAGEKRPLAALPYTPGLDVAAMDRRVDPCVDLFTYSCGGWKERNPVPPDQARWSVYGKLYDENQQYLWGILEEAARPDPARSPSRQKIGDYFAACMDEASVERSGIAPLRPEIDAIAALATKQDIARWLGAAHLAVGGGGMMFGFGADQDPKNSEQVIAWALAGGLGLPDRDSYLNKDAKSRKTRERYVEHVRRTLELLGEPKDRVARRARAIVRIETALAKASLTRVEKRDPYKTYHKMKVDDLQSLTPDFRWKDYLSGAGVPTLSELNVTEPEFFKRLGSLLAKESLDDWKSYLRWHLARERSAYLSAAFVRENFDFYRAHLRGVKEMQPRWKRCVGWVDRDLGEALGQVFVEKSFPPETRTRVIDMVTRIEGAMQARINSLPWMAEATKQQALAKLASLRNKIGHPERFRDYGPLEIKAGDFLGNVRRSLEFESRRQLGKIGKPVDRDEWGMTPPTVNAYYNPAMNDMNFPAGVLLPPLFDPAMDDAPNYGNTGATIGHELIHGFDDEGRQFDAKGNLEDWWTEEDAKEFEKRAACVADQYGQYVVVDDVRINSKLTLGEDVADLAGTVLAWVAWKDAIRGKPQEPRDGLTPEQRFFVGFAQWACENNRDEDLRVSAVTNPHSPGKYRINGVVANMPEFREAFACRAGQPLVREPACQIW